jgi:hypothetical protein
MVQDQNEIELWNLKKCLFLTEEVGKSFYQNSAVILG